MPLQELINQYEQLWNGGGGGGGSVSGSKHWKIITFNRVCPVFFAGGFTPAPPPPVIGPGTFNALALPGFTNLGIATFLSGPVSLSTMFSTRAIRGETVNEVIFCTHELNVVGDTIYIGDLSTLQGEAAAAISLKGPNQIYRFANLMGLNTLPLGNIALASSSISAQVRVSVLVS